MVDMQVKLMYAEVKVGDEKKNFPFKPCIGLLS
jgi:hypothetical protein